MKIALDYDQTFTADPELWTPFVRTALARGHAVAFVTFRRDDCHNSDIQEDAAMLGIDIVYCSGKQKSHCYQADIWIDDSPELIPSFRQLSAMCESCDAMGDTR